ncbi:MAG: DUF484 family protein [Chromatiales bacterium]|nr:DUF484 family protein [Chromatiales bacterium]
MSNNDTGVALDGGGAERNLVRWLRAHPDLFQRHPELVELLDIPHASGSASSLIEYQVRQLRSTNLQLQTTLETLVQNARQNEASSAKLHTLALGLLSTESVADSLGVVYASLQDSFSAHASAVRIYAAPPLDEQGCGEFVGVDAPRTADLDACMTASRPMCGLPDSETLWLLFGPRAVEVKSCALVKLASVRWRGVLALGARDGKRFAAGSGTVFLQQLGDMVTHALLRACSDR